MGVSRFVSRFIYSLTALVTIFLISITNHQISLVLAGFGLVYIFLCCFILMRIESSQINLDLQGLWQFGGLVIIPINSIVLSSIFKVIQCTLHTF